jgi:hypothetical protein
MFEFIKMMAIYAAASIAGCMWILHMVQRPRPIRWHVVLVAYGFFLSTQIVSYLFSIDRHTSFFGYYGRFQGGVLSHVAYCVLLFVFVQVFDLSTLRKLVKVSLIASVIVMMWGLPGRLLGFDMSCLLYRGEITVGCWTEEFRPHERMFSTLGQPNWLGAYLVAHFWLAAWLWLNAAVDKRTHGPTLDSRTFWYGVYLVVNSACIFFTRSRSAQLGLLVGACVLLFAVVYRRIPRRVFATMIVVLVLVSVVGGYAYVRSLLNVRSGEITHSGSIRLIVWEGAVKLGMRYPLTGTGPETFGYTYFLTRPEAHNLTSEKDFIYNKAHNELLNVFANTGTIGVLGFLFFVAIAIRALKGLFINTLLAAFVGLLVSHLLGFSTSSTQLLFVMIPMLGIVASRQTRNIAIVHPPRYMRIGISIISVILLVASLAYIGRYIQADRAYARALSHQSAGNYSQAIEEFSRALTLRTESVYADKFALTLASVANQLEADDETNDIIAELREKSILLNTYALLLSPRNPNYWKNRAKIARAFERSAKTDEEKLSMNDMYEEARANVRLLAPTDRSLSD